MLLHERVMTWKHIWWFLSLDAVAPFFEDMWVPIEDIASFHQGLRIQLAPAEVETDQDTVAKLNSIFGWFEHHYSLDSQSLMVHWASSIFVESGPDRNAELFWSIVPAAMAKSQRTEGKLVPWAESLMSQLRQKHKIYIEELEKRLDSLRSSQPSPWDLETMSIHGVDIAAVIDNIALISQANNFLENWEVCCSSLSSDELTELNKLVVPIWRERNMPEWQFAFPGSWRFELRPLINKFIHFRK